MNDGFQILESLDKSAEDRGWDKPPMLYRIDGDQVTSLGELAWKNGDDIYDSIAFMTSMGELGINDRTTALAIHMESFEVASWEEIQQARPDWAPFIAMIRDVKFPGVPLEAFGPTIVAMYCNDVFGSLAFGPKDVVFEGRIYLVVRKDGTVASAFRRRYQGTFGKVKDFEAVPVLMDSEGNTKSNQQVLGKKVAGSVAECMLQALSGADGAR